MKGGRYGEEGYSSSVPVTPRAMEEAGGYISRSLFGKKQPGRASDVDEEAIARISNSSPLSFFSLPSPTTPSAILHHVDARCCPNRDEEVGVEMIDCHGRMPTVLISGKPPPPLLLKFEDVKFKVTTKHMGSGCGGEAPMERKILSGVTGIAAPGQMLAMMGPSGSGKTTLLNILGGRFSHCISQMSGTVTYNDTPFHKKLKSRMGFVTQDDILYPHLTVRETLIYAALLRLPKQYSKKEKIERAEDIIQQLGLERCQETVIGGSFLRGVSGGERKRVCIGHEILIDPSLLFLDEPTSGLDSTIALRLIQLLQSIAQGGRTVVTTIHQPSTRLFNMFDQLILLSDGNLIYFGKAADASNYFETIGFSPLLTMNPAEYLIDLCSGNTNDILMPPSLKKQNSAYVNDGNNIFKEDVCLNIEKSACQMRPTPKDVKQYLVEACQKHMKSKEMGKFVESISTFVKEDNNQTKMGQSYDIQMREQWNTSWWQQFTILLMRGFKERRHEYLSSIRIFQVIATALIIGFLWWQSKTRNIEELEDQVGLLFFLSMYWGYLPLVTAIFTFPLERAVLSKERASNMYRLSAYFMSRTCGDMPLDMILPIIFLVMVYFMAHLQYSASTFFLTLFTLFLIVITSQGIGLLIGAALMDVKKATTLASVLFVTFILTGGFVLQHIPSFVSWMRYLSFQYYGFKLLLKVQYSSRCSHGTLACSLSTPALHGVTLHGGGQEAMAMITMAFAFRLFAYFALRHSKTSHV